jgi:hypothetical protein
LSADACSGNVSTSTNLLGDRVTNAAAPTHKCYEHSAPRAAPLSTVLASPPVPATAVKTVSADYFQRQSAEGLGWGENGSSNTFAHAAVACDWAADGSTNVASSARPLKTFRLFDGALIGGGGSDEGSERHDRDPASFSGFPSSRSWPAPDASRESQGLRLFRWRWK